jgi:hypothetical protein
LLIFGFVDDGEFALPDGFGYFISLNVLSSEFESLFHELNLFEFCTFINKFDDNGYTNKF